MPPYPMGFLRPTHTGNQDCRNGEYQQHIYGYRPVFAAGYQCLYVGSGNNLVHYRWYLPCVQRQ